jgi:hypothetical protein
MALTFDCSMATLRTRRVNGYFLATFPDGTTITARVDEDEKVKGAELYARVGEATVRGKGHGLFKDRVRVLYEVDGWKVYCVYYG